MWQHCVVCARGLFTQGGMLHTGDRKANYLQADVGRNLRESSWISRLAGLCWWFVAVVTRDEDMAACGGRLVLYSATRLIKSLVIKSSALSTQIWLERIPFYLCTQNFPVIRIKTRLKNQSRGPLLENSRDLPLKNEEENIQIIEEMMDVAKTLRLGLMSHGFTDMASYLQFDRDVTTIATAGMRQSTIDQLFETTHWLLREPFTVNHSLWTILREPFSVNHTPWTILREPYSVNHVHNVKGGNKLWSIMRWRHNVWTAL